MNEERNYKVRDELNNSPTSIQHQVKTPDNLQDVSSNQMQDSQEKNEESQVPRDAS